MPGVAAVITHKDIHRNRWGLGGVPDQQVLADARVRYHGDAVAVVAAETPEQARAAADAIEVGYEPLPVVTSIEDALKDGAPLLHEEFFDSNICCRSRVRLGDVEKGFAESDLIVEHCYNTQKAEHAPIEPHVGVAQPEADGRLLITCTTSRPYAYAFSLCDILGLNLNRLRVASPPGQGGSFGAKNEVMLEAWIAALALKTRRPVKMSLTREEEFFSSTTRHAWNMTYKTGVKKDGTLLAQQLTLYSDTGAYIGLGKAQQTKGIHHACGPYIIPNVSADAYLVFTNGLLGGAMRGMGVPQVCFACESQMDRVAEALGMDPAELRRKNMFGRRGLLPNGQLLYSAGARATFERALELFEQAGKGGLI
jgi:CO/xanthine dehydrogenase Mo-binding subunit